MRVHGDPPFHDPKRVESSPISTLQSRQSGAIAERTQSQQICGEKVVPMCGMLGGFIGAIVGGTLGVAVMAAMQMGVRADRERELDEKAGRDNRPPFS